MRFLLSLCIFLSIPHLSWSKNSCDDVYVLNLTFGYDEGGKMFLPGVAPDEKVQTEIYRNGKQGTDLHQVRLSTYGDVESGQAKAKFLQKLKELTKDHDNIQFNYSGHAEAFKSDAEIRQRMAMYKDADKKAKGQESDSIGFYPKTGSDMDVNNLPAPPLLKTSIEIALDRQKATASLDYFLMTQECVNCLRHCESGICVSGCSPENGMFEFKVCMETCREGSWSCTDDCKKNVCITQSDMSEVFKGKHLSGIHDACYSAGLGALKGIKGGTMVGTSTSSPVMESPQGGMFNTGFVQSNTDPNWLCSLDSDGNGALSYMELFYQKSNPSHHYKMALRHEYAMNWYGTKPDRFSPKDDCAISLKGVDCSALGNERRRKSGR